MPLARTVSANSVFYLKLVVLLACVCSNIIGIVSRGTGRGVGTGSKTLSFGLGAAEYLNRDSYQEEFHLDFRRSK